jgi:hypothetical protein
MLEVEHESKWVRSSTVPVPASNGKSTKRDESTGEGTFNKRDLTPVGQRHTPVDGDAIVQPDPRARAAHERNRNRRIKYGNPESD